MFKKTCFIISTLLALFVLTMFLKNGKWGIANGIIWGIRFNKWIIMAMGAFSVGFSTWILQGITRNKIVGSSFFGITSFNILVLVILYSFVGNSFDINYVYKWLMPFISIGASITITALLSVTLFGNSKYSKKNLVLVGIMLNYLFIAIAYMYIKFLDPDVASSILDISIGSINEGYEIIIPVVLGCFQILSIVWYMLIYKGASITNVSEEMSLKLGNNTKAIKVQQIMIVGINVAVAFSFIGSVSFLGIIAANITLKWFKQSRYNGIISGIVAVLVTAIAYFVMNSVFKTYYPIGITTSLISVPYFIYIILRREND